MENINRNQRFDLAVSYILFTRKHVFLTGRAGTGKTTLLKFVCERTTKKYVIAAPTGVAAINAGGVTLHSLFQLPFGSFFPERQSVFGGRSSNGTDVNGLLRNLRLNKQKRKLIQELDLLIIDEVSMVRADLLDAVNVVLQHIRRNNESFGGVQMLLIGDLYQLPPVVKDDEWSALAPYYLSPFFFDSRAIRQTELIYIELNRIYRQSDERFISILNAIRNNTATEDDLNILNRHYDPSFHAEADDGYIILTAHNSTADRINTGNLARIPAEQVQYQGEVEGEFNDSFLPVPKSLSLKVGAQVMFIKNDKGDNRRYYNGKIGIVSRLNKEEIWVRFPGASSELQVELETWKNIKYEYSDTDDSIKEETLGLYRQYPLRLAWAITIHKSQGLTFQKAIVDAAASFAPGQVYVALSRLTSLSGLVLRSPIPISAIQTDARIENWYPKAEDEQLLTLLAYEQERYLHDELARTFNFNKIRESYQEQLVAYDGMRLPDLDAATEWCRNGLANISKLIDVSVKFSRQIQQLIGERAIYGYKPLSERTQAASTYFQKEIREQLMDPLETHFKEVEKAKGSKKYLTMLQSIRAMLHIQTELMKTMVSVMASIASGAGINEAMQNNIKTLAPLPYLTDDERHESDHLKSNAKSTPAKTTSPKNADPTEAQRKKLGLDTKSWSLRLFLEGKSVDEIARERGMAATTIEGHLSHFIPTGEVQVADLVSSAHETAIRAFVATHGLKPIGDIRAALGENITYNAIKVVAKQIELENSVE